MEGLTINSFDLTCLGLIAFTALIGFWRGLFFQLMTLVALGVAIFVAMFLATPIARLAHGSELIDSLTTYYLARAVATGVIYLLLLLVVWALDRKLKKSGVQSSFVNRTGGLLLGGAKGVVVVGLGLFWVTYWSQESIARHLPTLATSQALKWGRQLNPFSHQVVANNLKLALKLASDPATAGEFQEFLAARGVHAKEFIQALHQRRLVPLLQNPKVKKLLLQTNAFATLHVGML